MDGNIFSRIAAALALVIAGGGTRGNPEYDAHLKAIDDQLQAGAAHEAADNTAQSARLDVLEQGIQTIAAALPAEPASAASDVPPADPMTGALPVSDTNGGDSAPASDVPPATPSTSGTDTGGGEVPPAAPAV